MMRNEFGVERSSCTCQSCTANCMFMPGFLIPSDLDRMIPAGADPLQWAEDNLLASPGALVIKDGVQFRIPTLVPRVKTDGSCIHYKMRGCAIWENSPFGCAFFGCGAQEEDRLGHLGLAAVHMSHIAFVTADERPLYTRIWTHLWTTERRQVSADLLREGMQETE